MRKIVFEGKSEVTYINQVNNNCIIFATHPNGCKAYIRKEKIDSDIYMLCSDNLCSEVPCNGWSKAKSIKEVVQKLRKDRWNCYVVETNKELLERLLADI